MYRNRVTVTKALLKLVSNGLISLKL